VRLLFITRKYPPSVGGMEKVSYNLSQELSKQIPTSIIAWGGSQKWLPFFLIKAFFQSLFTIPSKNITNIHIADGLLSPLGLVLKIISRKKVTATVHGLDITYKNKLYQAIVLRCLSRLDKIICISSATLDECVKRGIPASKCTVIPWGVYPDEFKIKATRKDLEKLAGMDLKNKKVLTTVGRLVRRKGVAWFIENVMPKLSNEYVYVVAGDGPEKVNIQQKIVFQKLDKRVKLLGKVSYHDLKVLYNTADVFVMPNIKVEDDIEGFGIVAIEASSTGTPVVASRIDGIGDVICNSKNGFLVQPYNAKHYLELLKQAATLNRENIYKYIRFNFSWTSTAHLYLGVFNA
jgi:glycosyltransferase involved in cell wall biosynthesis